MSRIEAELPGVDAIVPTHNEIVVLDGMHAVPESAPVPTLHPDRSLAPVPGARDAAAAPTAPAAATAAITDYRLVTGADAAELSAAVTAALGEGYVPYGGPGIGAVDGAAVYLQALVRR